MDFQYIFTGGVNEANVANAIGNISLFLVNGATKIIFFISSLGGDLESGIRLYDFLKSLPVPVETVAFGQVASAGVTIYLAGTERKCTKRASFFIHEGSFSNAYQNTSIKMLEETTQLLNNSNKKNIEIISLETGKSTVVVKKAIDAGTNMTASQAKSFGLVHATIDKLNLKQAQPPQPPQINPVPITPVPSVLPSVPPPPATPPTTT